MTEDLRPRCPQCGEPARSVLTLGLVRYELCADGTKGKVLGARHLEQQPETYMCGGAHAWEQPK